MKNRIRDIHRVVTVQSIQIKPEKREFQIKHGIVFSCNGEKTNKDGKERIS